MSYLNSNRYYKCIAYFKGVKMKLYWVNKCKDNSFRRPKCQNMIGDKSGQMPLSSKNHKVQMFDGQIKCVVCNTTVGYFPHRTFIFGEPIRQGMTTKILDNIDFVTPIDQKGI